MLDNKVDNKVFIDFVHEVSVMKVAIGCRNSGGNHKDCSSYRYTTVRALVGSREDGDAAPMSENKDALRADYHCDESMKGEGANYRGCQRFTKAGRECQRWAVQTPHTQTWGGAAYVDPVMVFCHQKKSSCRTGAGLTRGHG